MEGGREEGDEVLTKERGKNERERREEGRDRMGWREGSKGMRKG